MLVSGGEGREEEEKQERRSHGSRLLAAGAGAGAGMVCLGEAGEWGRKECGLRRNSASVVLSAWVLLQVSGSFQLFIDVFKGYFKWGVFFLKWPLHVCFLWIIID